MGRHGGGSRSGGSSHSHSRSGSGSRSGGSSIRTSKSPFKGCYNRSYYDRKGRYHSYYTSDASFGTRKGWNTNLIFSLLITTITIFIIAAAMFSSTIHFGSKLHGDVKRIQIVDTANVFTTEEAAKTEALLREIYQASGMPVTIYTDTFDWKQYYTSIEVYSEELYYQMGFEEDAMIILFTTDNNSTFYNWEYDMYCGDETIACLSDQAFNTLLDNFQKGMANQNLYQALEFSWNSIMDDLGKTSVDWTVLSIALPFLILIIMFYIPMLSSVKLTNDAYRYFKENPNQYDTTPMTLYSECPSCGASNTEQNETCSYCGTLLKISDTNVTFINPK